MNKAACGARQALIPAAIAPTTKIQSIQIRPVTRRGRAFSEQQAQQQHSNQYASENAPRILQAVGDDLRTPGPQQQLLHGELPIRAI